jgi:hypothetical protein
MVPGAPATVVARMNDQVSEAAARDGVLILDVARESAGRRRRLVRRQGKLEIAPQAAPLYGDLAARFLAARRGLSKKCLVGAGIRPRPAAKSTARPHRVFVPLLKMLGRNRRHALQFP